MNRKFLSFIAIAALFAVGLFCFQSAAQAEDEAITGTVVLADITHDYASTQSVFGPGPGFWGNLLNDYHWVLTLNLSSKQVIKSIVVEHKIAGEAWSSSAKQLYGKDLYPVVVYKDGVKLNGKYDQAFGPFSPGTLVLDLYGQIETYPFAGGTLHVVFSDGPELSYDIPPPLVPLDNSKMGCTDPENGINYNVASAVTYTTNGTDSYTAPDYCIDLAKGLLAEALCGGNGEYAGKQPVYSYYTCTGGCSEGACLLPQQEQQPVPAPEQKEY